jgi:hypothetical protein
MVADRAIRRARRERQGFVERGCHKLELDQHADDEVAEIQRLRVPRHDARIDDPVARVALCRTTQCIARKPLLWECRCSESVTESTA